MPKASDACPVPVPRESVLELYERRILVLIENTKEEGGGFSQILLDPDQFVKVSGAIFGCFPVSRDPENEDLEIRKVPLDLGKPLPGKVFEGMRTTA